MLGPSGADRLVVILSDIEMGAGGVLDDFPHSGFLAELLSAYSRPPFVDLQIDLVLNGDTFDLLKTSVDGAYPRLVTVELALAKLARIRAVHGAFFEGLRAFLSAPGAPRRVHFVVGNHDLELVFPEVQQALREAIGHPEVAFPGHSFDLGLLHVEHGCQVDPLFRLDTGPALLKHQGSTILALPWGAVSILDVLLPMHDVFYDLDRLKPRRRVFELLPEVRDHVVGAFWRYWTQDYWRDALWGGDPVRKVSWTLLKEVAYRFGTLDPGVADGHAFRRRVAADDRTRLLVAGHLHQAAWWSHGDRKVLRTGCFRDEFMLDDAGNVVRRIPKTYAEVFMRDGVPVRSHLVEVDGPAPRPGAVPTSVFDVLERARPLLESAEDRAAVRRQSIAQEAKERASRE